MYLSFTELEVFLTDKCICSKTWPSLKTTFLGECVVTRTALQIPTWQLHVINLIQSVKTYIHFLFVCYYI